MKMIIKYKSMWELYWMNSYEWWLTQKQWIIIYYMKQYNDLNWCHNNEEIQHIYTW